VEVKSNSLPVGVFLPRYGIAVKTRKSKIDKALRKAIKDLMAPDIESRRRAMDTFERATYTRFYWYVYRHLGNEVESVDVLQNVYLGIWEKPERLRNVTSWPQLCGTVYHYYARSLFRSAYRNKKRQSPLLDKTLESLLPKEPSVIEKIEQKELCELVRQKLKRLSALDRKCIKLWMKGASYRQIAIELKANVGAVKMRISRAFKKLRRMFDEDNPKD
jgi:RNA polymerase sigma factor (sigma-70 family)